MTEIKEKQIEALKAKIYGVIDSEDVGLGEANDIRDAVEFLIVEWIDENQITVID